VVTEPSSPVHSLWIADVERMVDEEGGVFAEPSSLKDNARLWEEWEQEDRILGTPTSAAVKALRRQVLDEEEEELQWSSVTDLLLNRLGSKESL